MIYLIFILFAFLTSIISGFNIVSDTVISSGLLIDQPESYLSQNIATSTITEFAIVAQVQFDYYNQVSNRLFQIKYQNNSVLDFFIQYQGYQVYYTVNYNNNFYCQLSFEYNDDPINYYFIIYENGQISGGNSQFSYNSQQSKCNSNIINEISFDQLTIGGIIDNTSPILISDFFLFDKALTQQNISDLMNSVQDINYPLENEINYNNNLISYNTFNIQSFYKKWNSSDIEFVSNSSNPNIELVMTNISDINFLNFVPNLAFDLVAYNLYNYEFSFFIYSYTAFPFINYEINYDNATYTENVNVMYILLLADSKIFICFMDAIYEEYQSINSGTSFEVTCEINNLNPGIYPLYISVNGGYSFISLNQSLTVLQYTQSQIEQQINNPVTINNAIINTDDQYILPIEITFSIACFFMVVAIIFEKIFPYMTTKVLTKIDKVYLKPASDDFMDQDLNKSKEVAIGPGNEIHYRTSIIGGLATIFIFIMCTGLSITYLYVNISNNEVTTSLFSSSNGNLIPVTSSFINVTSIFVDTLYTPCVIPNTINTCDSSWQITSSMTGNIVCSEIITNAIAKTCLISWFCTNCQTNSIGGISLNIQNYGFYMAYDHLEYQISANSFGNSTTQIYGILPNQIGSVIADPIQGVLDYNPTVVSTVLIPSVYTYYSDKPQTGFVADSQSISLSNYYPISNYNIPSLEEFATTELFIPYLETNVPLLVQYNQITSISAQINVVLNPTWQFITTGSRQSILTIISNTFSLDSLSLVIIGLLINFLMKRFMRKFYYRITCCCHRKTNIEKQTSQFSHVARNSEISVNPIHEDLSRKPTVVDKQHHSINSSIELVVYKNGMSTFRNSIGNLDDSPV